MYPPLNIISLKADLDLLDIRSSSFFFALHVNLMRDPKLWIHVEPEWQSSEILIHKEVATR
jgi:hypothetical protein